MAVFGNGNSQRAPEPIDVHDLVRLIGYVCFNPQVTEAFEGVKSWGLVDLFRRHVPDSGQYTYFDYRTKHGVAEGKGWRVDHILATRPLAARSTDACIDLEPRRGEKPSDHAPMVVKIAT